jgi:hypothetical protein
MVAAAFVAVNQRRFKNKIVCPRLINNGQSAAVVGAKLSGNLLQDRIKDNIIGRYGIPTALLYSGLHGRVVEASLSSGPISVSFHLMPSIGSWALAVVIHFRRFVFVDALAARPIGAC